MLASSRGPRAAANTCGRDKSRPYERGARLVTNREHANPAMPQTSVGADSISARFVAAPGSAGGISGLRAAAARRLASETRLRAQ